MQHLLRGSVCQGSHVSRNDGLSWGVSWSRHQKGIGGRTIDWQQMTAARCLVANQATSQIPDVRSKSSPRNLNLWVPVHEAPALAAGPYDKLRHYHVNHRC